MRLVLCLSHSIEEHDQLKLLSGLGYEVFSIGGYIDPLHPHDPKRPPLDVPRYPELQAAVDALKAPDNLGAAQSHIPDKVLEWLGDDGGIIFHHQLPRLFGQWERISDWMEGSSGRRVIWRTVGQSVASNEEEAQTARTRGLEVVRYSPKERNIPGYIGEDALIRFYADPDEYGDWNGESPIVTNVTQELKARHPYTNYEFWKLVTEDLSMVVPAGPGSEEIGGLGQIPYDDMRMLLRNCRCYLYTGTQPASYTLGLLEALMTGIPVVSIGPEWMQVFPYGPDLFEGHELAWEWENEPYEAKYLLQELLHDHDYAREVSKHQRERIVAEFGKEKVGADWRAFLGEP